VVVTKAELRALHALVVSDDIDEDTRNKVETDIAKLLGWKNVTFDKWVPGWRGDCPRTGDRLIIPSYLSSLDAAVTTIPDLWVENYRRRFDDTVVAQCYPRGDLGLHVVRAECKRAPQALTAVGILAHIASLETKENSRVPSNT
jgi:hypothetical protein